MTASKTLPAVVGPGVAALGGLQTKPFQKMGILFFIKANKVDAFLPSMMKILEVGSEDEKLTIILVLRNILGQLKKAKASSIAMMLVGKVLPLFDSVRLMWEPEPCSRALPRSPALKAVLRAGSALLEWILGFAAKRCSCLLWNLTLEHRPHRSHGQGAAVPKLTFPPSHQECSQLRELSLWLFRDLLKSVLSRDEKKMRRDIQSALVPLLFRLNDHLPSVAKVWISRLSTGMGGLPPPRDPRDWGKGCWQQAGLPQCRPWVGSLQN